MLHESPHLEILLSFGPWEKWPVIKYCQIYDSQISEYVSLMDVKDLLERIW